MNVSLEDMKSCVQEWFAQALDYNDLREIYTTVRFEADKQFEYMADSIAEQRTKDKYFE